VLVDASVAFVGLPMRILSSPPFRVFRPVGLRVATAPVLALGQPANGAPNYYFDLNGPTAGSGAVTGSHPWAGSTWTTASDGAGTNGALPTRTPAIFSAGGDGLYAHLTLTGATRFAAVGQSVTVPDTLDLSTATPPRRFLRLRVTAP